MTDEELELPTNDTAVMVWVIAGVMFLLITVTGALAINAAVDAENAVDSIQENRLEFCRRLNTRLTKLDVAVRTALDSPAAAEASALISEALEPEDCARTFDVSAP